MAFLTHVGDFTFPAGKKKKKGEGVTEKVRNFLDFNLMAKYK